jgi:transposase
LHFQPLRSARFRVGVTQNGLYSLGVTMPRTLLVVGATAVMRYARQKPTWVTGLLARKPARLVSVALANKMARIAWVLLARKQTYQTPASAAA